MCDKCNNINPCACNEPTFCGCSTKLDLLCTYYSGETLEPMGITEGMDGTQVISKINEYVTNILQNLDISPTVIESIGNGVAVYKGLSAGIIDEFKSLVGDIGIDITPEDDMVRFSINQDWLETIIIQTIDNNNLLPKLEFKWSELDSPKSPEVSLEGWRDDSTPDSKWMAIKSSTGETTTPSITSKWEVVKVKGETGPMGPMGPMGPRGADGATGGTGSSSVTSTVFKRASSKPARPVGGDYFNNIPDGWSDGIPEEDGNPVWMSIRLFTSNGGAPQEPEWSDPCLTVDTASIDFEFSNYTGPNPGTPDQPIGGAIWDNNATPDDVWMAMAQISNGVRGEWKIFKIKGEKGNNSVTINVFKRSELEPSIPIGGSYNDPIPDGWSDGIPEEDGNPVWMSTRVFSSDGLFPQQDSWTTPVLIADTGSIDYEFSNFTGTSPGDPTTPLNGAVWTNNSDENTIWMAVAKISNGVRGQWTVTRIKGEKGDTGAPGESGVGFTVMTSNPVESLAVGSDNTTSSVRTFEVPIHVYKGMRQLTPTTSTSLASDAYRVVVPPSPFTGVSVSRHPSSAAILIYTVAPGTVFGDESINSEIEVVIGDTNTQAKTSFTIVPIKTAEDALSLTLHTDAVVVKYDAWGNLIAPSTVSLRTVLQNYSDTIHWATSPVIPNVHGSTTQSGAVHAISSGQLFSANNSVATITASTSNGLYDTVTIVKTIDGMPGAPGAPGQPGAPGIKGTTGPTPRLLELVNGGVYENGGQFIDYAYYRTNDTGLEGWYTVKVVDGVRTTVQYNGGIPDATPSGPWVKAPFTKEMSFGTIVAEQANLAGFIFRNQVLYSQTGSNNASCHPSPGEFNANLSLNGLQGIIKFLDRMVMDTSGIVLKDNCGKPRMLFQWLEPGGIPILRFLNADGSIKWEAGQEGYKEIIVYTTPESWSNGSGAKKMTVETTPTESNVPRNWACTEDNEYTVRLANNLYEGSPAYDASIKTLYKYRAPTPAETATASQLADNGKVFTGKSRTHYGYAQGWYLTQISIVTPLEYPELSKESIEGTFTRYVDGVGVETIKRLVTTFIKPCVAP